MKTNIHVWSYLAEFFLEWEMFLTNLVKKIETHILYSISFLLKLYRLWDNVEKIFTAGQTTDNSTAHAHCVLDKESYRRTLRICGSYCISKPTVVTRTRLNIAMSVHRLSSNYSLHHNAILKTKNECYQIKILITWMMMTMIWLCECCHGRLSVEWPDSLCSRYCPSDPQNETLEGCQRLQSGGRWVADKQITLLANHVVFRS